MSATLTYGSYTSDNGEVVLGNYEALAIRSPREGRIMLRRRMHVEGVIVRDSQAALLARIEDFIDNFEQEQLSDAVLTLNGAATPHVLSNNSITGVRIANRSWPKGSPEELVRCRTYQVILETLEFAPEGSQIEEYHDSVAVYGNGGPDWRYVQMPRGLSRLQILSETSPVTAVQQGTSMGLQGYVLPTGPVVAALEQGTGYMLERETPRRVGNVFAHYPMRWRYQFTNSGFTDAAPVPK